MTQTINANLFRLNRRKFFFNSDVIIFDNLDQLYLLNRNIFFFIKKYKKFNFFFLNYNLQRCYNNKFKIFFFGFNIKKWKFIKKKFKSDIFLKKKEFYLYKSFLYKYKKVFIKKLKYKILKKKYIYLIKLFKLNLLNLHNISKNILKLLNNISKSFKNKFIFSNSILMNNLIKKNIKIRFMLTKNILFFNKWIAKITKIISIIFLLIFYFNTNRISYLFKKFNKLKILSVITKNIQANFLKDIVFLHYIIIKKRSIFKKSLSKFYNKKKLKRIIFFKKIQRIKINNIFSLKYIKLNHVLNVDIYKFLINYKIFSLFIKFFFFNFKFQLKKKKLRFIKLIYFLRGNQAKKYLSLNFKILYRLLKKKYVRKIFKKRKVKKYTK